MIRAHLRRLCPLGLYRVAGHSMAPTYTPGDTLLGLRWLAPRAGRVVVIRRDRPLIKRIARVEADRIFLLGDNLAHSTDSRHFGLVPRADIEAIIVAKLR